MVHNDQREFDELIEKLLHKLLSDPTSHEPLNVHEADGKVIINVNHNYQELLLLIVYLLNNQSYNVSSSQENYREQTSTKEVDDLIQTVENLRQKNKDILEEISGFSSDGE